MVGGSNHWKDCWPKIKPCSEQGLWDHRLLGFGLLGQPWWVGLFFGSLGGACNCASGGGATCAIKLGHSATRGNVATGCATCCNAMSGTMEEGCTIESGMG